MTTTYSAFTGFSNSCNPNGVWTYLVAGVPLTFGGTGADSPDGSGRADPFRTLRVGLLVERSASAQYRRNLRRSECDRNNSRW